MVDKRSEHLNFFHLLHTLVLIVVEASLTFLLKSDQESRKLAQNLIRQQALVELRTSFPATVTYVTFTAKGVLLDSEKPARPIDAVVSASFTDLMHGFLTAPASSLKRITIDGSIEFIEELRVLMHSFNIQQIFMHWMKSDWIKALILPEEDESGNKRSHRASRKQRELMKKLNEQKNLMDQMSLQAKEQAFVIAQLNRQIKMLIVAGLVLFALLMTGFVGAFVFLH